MFRLSSLFDLAFATHSVNAFPALNFGVFLAFIFIVAPVCGLRTITGRSYYSLITKKKL
jgi:hypothetical protein